MVPKGWVLGCVGDLLIGLESGVSVNGEDRHAQPGEKSVLKVSAVSYGFFDSKASKVIDKAEISRAKTKPRAGQIIVSRSNTESLVGASAYVDKDYQDLFLPDKLWQTVPKPDANMKWLSYVLASEHVRYTLSKLATGTSGSMKNITKGELLTLKILIPPLPEQKKIAQALSTWDKAIMATEQLLANSHQQKKVLRQQLLTGKTRFPEFNGKWERRELGKLLEYKQPTLYLVSSTDYNDDYEIPVLTAGKTFILGYTNELEGIYREKLPVIIFDDFTTDSKFVDFPFKAKSSAMKILTARDGVSIKYVFEAMQMLDFKIGGHQRHWISIFSNQVIAIPEIAEQRKIASALSCVDGEIEILKQKLNNLKQEKKALVQQLLTGKCRMNVEVA
ncbi:restriction endonuclease subunit S [Serratia marcescens]|uniref:restriction endonuclease subunit S n=1 Tax=Serratia marcescens TaxID=615 RepID=UPI0009070693|nr:restriction endonuclease subunit S [Serratia marcescens]